jgi:Trypsin
LRIGAFVVALAAALAMAIPAGAITNGVPDAESANPHPEVGFVVFKNRTGMHIGCSGTLIAPTVFLTAAHCDVTSLATDGLWVSFRADQPIDERGEAAIPAADLIVGTFVSAPGFTGNRGGQEGSRDSHDIAVVLLAREATGITPATIAPVGLLSLLGVKNGLRGTVFTNVGYGAFEWVLGSGPPFPEFPGRRLQSTSAFQALEQAYVRLSQNEARGLGGTCNGDSGGPQFLGTAHEIVSITVTGDPFCQAQTVGYRVDTAFVHEFLGQFLS